MTQVAMGQAPGDAKRRPAVNDTWTRALAFLALAAGLLSAQGSSAQTGSADSGHDLVLRNCGMCHAVGRTDASPNPAAPAFRDLHLRYSVDNLAKALSEGLIAGHPQMPEFRFNQHEIADIIRYLNSIQTLRPAKVDPAKPAPQAAQGRSGAPMHHWSNRVS